MDPLANDSVSEIIRKSFIASSPTVSISESELTGKNREKHKSASSSSTDGDFADIVQDIRDAVGSTPVKTAPAPSDQSSKGSGLSSSGIAQGLRIAHAAAEFTGSEQKETMGLMADTAEVFAKAQDLFKRWWQQVVEFFQAAASKAADAATSVMKALKKVLATVIEYVSASYENARQWFVSMSCVSGTDPKVPDVVAHQLKPVDWDLNPNCFAGDFSVDVFSVPLRLKTLDKATKWIERILLEKSGEELRPSECAIYELTLGSVIADRMAGKTDSDRFELYSSKFAEYARIARESDYYVAGTTTAVPYEFITSPPFIRITCGASTPLTYAYNKAWVPVQSQFNWLASLDIKTLTQFLTTLTASVLGSLKASTEFFKSFDAAEFSMAFSSFLSGFNNFKRSGLGDTIEWYIDRVVHFCSGRNFSTRYSLQRRWDKAVQELNTELRKVSGMRNVSPHQVGAITTLLADLEDMFAAMMHFFPRETAGTKNQYEDLKRRAAQYDCGVVPMQRHKPVAFLFTGEAGVGKTSVQSTIISELFSVVEALVDSQDYKDVDIDSIRQIARNPSHFPYNCAECKADFDDGYKNNAFVTFEELGTIKDPQVSRDWVTKFFRTIDKEPLLLNMAFADKGKRYMNSPIVIATTNTRDIPAASSFSDITAVHRRIEFHMLVEHPPDQEFDIGLVRLTFTDSCLKVLRNPRLTPSRILSTLLQQDVLRRCITVDELINAAACVYLERIHDFQRHTSRHIPVLPNFLDTAHAHFHTRDRNGMLTPAAVPTIKQTHMRLENHLYAGIRVVLSLTESEMDLLMEGLLCLDGFMDFDTFMNALTLVQPDLSNRIHLAEDDDVLGDKGIDEDPETFFLTLKRCFHVTAVVRAGDADKEYPLHVRTETFHDTYLPPCELLVVPLGDRKDRIPVVSQMNTSITDNYNGSWADPDPDYKPSFYERYYYARSFLTSTVELFHYHPTEIRSIVEKWYRTARSNFLHGVHFDFNVDRYSAFDLIDQSVVRGIIGESIESIYTGMQKLTAHFPQMRVKALGMNDDSTVASKRKLIQDGMFVAKNVKALLWLTEQWQKRIRVHSADEEYWFCLLSQGIGNAHELTRDQERSLNHSLKFIGRMANRRGHVTRLHTAQVVAYEKRVRANEIRNNTKPKKRARAAEVAPARQSMARSRVDIDRRQSKKKTLLSRKQRAMKSERVYSQIGRADNPPEQVLAASVGWWKEAGTVFGQMIRPLTLTEKAGVYFSRDYIHALINASCKSQGKNGVTDPAFDIFYAMSRYAHEGLSKRYHSYWGNRTLLFVSYLTYIKGRSPVDLSAIDATVYSYARTHLPPMTTMPESPEGTWQRVAALVTAICLGLRMDEATEFVDHYVCGSAAPLLREKITDAQVNEALARVALEVPRFLLKRGYSVEMNSAKVQGPQVASQEVDLEQVEIASLFPITWGDIVLGSLAIVCGAGAIALTVSAIYTIYKAHAARSTVAEAQAEINSKDTITNGELLEIEERLSRAGIIPVYYRKKGTDRIDIGPTFLEDQSREEDPNRVPNPAKMKIKEDSRMREAVVLQSGSSYEHIFDKIISNMYKIHVRVNDGWMPIADLTFVKGRIAEVPAHVLKAMRACKGALRFDPWIHAPTRAPFIVADQNRIKTIYSGGEGDERALILFDLQQLPLHVNLVKHYATEEQILKMGKSKLSGFVLGLTNDCEKHLGVFSNGFQVDGRFNCDGRDINLQEPQDCYDYTGAVSGACGRHLLCEHQGVMLIRSTHVAGSESSHVGRAVVVTRNFLEKLIAKVLSQGAQFEVHTMSQELSDPVVPKAYQIEPDAISTGVVTSALDKTNFVPTVFTHKKFRGGAPTRPAQMTEETLRIARDKEAKRAACREPHADAWAIVYRYTALLLSLFLRFAPFDMVSGCSRLSHYEALTHHPKLNRFSPTTSRGIRLKMRRWKKEEVLGYDGVPPVPEVRASFEADIDAYLKLGDEEQEYPYQVNFDKLKDEPLEHRFVDAGKCRLFNITDFYDNVLIKIALGALVGTLEALFLVGPQSCGINMRGSVARDIYNTFVGFQVLAFDVSGFDNTVNSIAFPVIMFLIQQAYASRKDRLWAYWAVLATYLSLRFDKGKGRWRGHGNTSGNWITTWLNTITNVVYFGIATIWLALKHGDDPVAAIHDLKLRVYSDDNLSALDRSWYTPTNLRDAFMFLFHVELTNADKSEVTDQSVYTIDDAEFLSRTFRCSGGLVYCPLAIPSLLGQLYYVRCPRSLGGNRRRFILKQLTTNLGNVASELYEYPKEIADNIASEIFSFLDHVGLSPAIFPYDFEFDRHSFKLSLV